MNTLQKLKQSQQFIEQLQTDTKAWYLTHPRVGELDQAERKLLKQASFEMSLWNWQELDVSQLTIEDAFKGTNVQTAMEIDEEVTRTTLITMIGTCIEIVDAKKSLTEGQEYKMVIDELIKLFPAFTIEDWRLCLYMMAKEVFGGYFERLKLAQFVECFTKYDQLKQPVVMQIRQKEAEEFELMQKETLRYITPEFGTEFNPIAARVDKVEWMKGENRLTYDEREEMRLRDKNRNK